MKKQFFHEKWKVENGVKDPFDAMMGMTNEKEILLPHDGMISEERSADCENKNQTGYYPCSTYTYTKEFDAPEEWSEMQVQLEFEGVMKKAMVFINGENAARHAYGYSQFFVDLKPYVKCGGRNQIKVIAIQENKSSRWYPGSGIYRDVVLHTGGAVCIVPESLRITTREVEDGYAVLTIDAEFQGDFAGRREVEFEIELFHPDGTKAAGAVNTVTVPGEKKVSSHMRLTVSDPELWSVEKPSLYLCKAKVKEQGNVLDEEETEFGIRTLKLDARKGLRINGKSVKLRGACIHHDNGILGSCTLERAEEYRCKKLKEAGFNSIRSSHHPVSKAMLRSCDRLGMLVVDELADMWNTPKNSHDFAFEFGDCWEDEIKRMVAKDYNHPSVIFYSVGNEMPEIGNVGGRIQNREITAALRKADPTRYVTSGINGMLALAGMPAEEGEKMAKQFMPGDTQSMNNLLEKDLSENKETKAEERTDVLSEGSEKLNDVMGDIPYEVRDLITTSPAMTRQLKEVCDELDVIGLNYMPARHVLEHELNPDHIVMGSESYPTEIARLWEIVEQYPYVIGDFTWTGYDYLGEAGIGSFHYDVMPEGQGVYPDRLAYCGDINLNGYRRPVSYLREIAYGRREIPFISVERVDRYGYGCLRNHWKYDDAVDSWTFPGYEGKPAKVKVLSASEEVELFLNGVSQGKKSAGKAYGYTAEYEIQYQPGILRAVGYDADGEQHQIILETSGTPKNICVEANTDTLYADGRDALILDIFLTDEKGIPNMWEKKNVRLLVEGPAVLAGFGNADPAGTENYQTSVCETFDGRVIAAIRTTNVPGMITITIEVEGLEKKVLKYRVQ